MSNLNSNEAGYPPYNVVKLDDDSFVIELAVAGFSKNSIDITVQDSVLNIEGEQETDDRSDEETNYLYKGISSRKFRRTFNLADYVEVKDATVKDGVLKVILERHVPEELKPRTIPVNFK
jgi:molecular chaperone IbpA